MTSTVALPGSSARLASTALPLRAKVTVSVVLLSSFSVATSVGIFNTGSTRSWNNCARMLDSLVSMSSTFAVSMTLPAPFFQTSLPSLSFDFSNASVSLPRFSSTRAVLNDRPVNMSLLRSAA